MWFVCQKINRQLAVHGRYFKTANCRIKIPPRYFEIYLEFFNVLESIYVFPPRFLANPPELTYSTQVLLLLL
jgi:hypothetical protein